MSFARSSPGNLFFVDTPLERAIDAVFFDRDGTLVHDVPYNDDPERVEVMPTALQAVAEARAAGLATAVLTNQSGIARGLITRAQTDAVNARVDAVFGGFDAWRVCPHGPDDGCACRKPAPGMLLDAAAELGVEPSRVLFIGDIAADLGAASAAGAVGVLVPTDVTLPAEIAAAPRVARTLLEAVRLVTRSAASDRPAASAAAGGHA